MSESVLSLASSNEPRLIDIDQPSSSFADNQTSVKTIRSSDSIAEGDKQRKIVDIACMMCPQVIKCQQYVDDTPRQLYELVDHLEKEHKQKMCPICSTLFDTRIPFVKSYFNNHGNYTILMISLAIYQFVFHSAKPLRQYQVSQTELSFHIQVSLNAMHLFCLPVSIHICIRE